jgi:hypothetical protein
MARSLRIRLSVLRPTRFVAKMAPIKDLRDGFSTGGADKPDPSLRARDKIGDSPILRGAKQSRVLQKAWIASSQELLAMTTARLSARWHS